MAGDGTGFPGSVGLVTHHGPSDGTRTGTAVDHPLCEQPRLWPPTWVGRTAIAFSSCSGTLLYGGATSPLLGAQGAPLVETLTMTAAPELSYRHNRRNMASRQPVRELPLA